MTRTRHHHRRHPHRRREHDSNSSHRPLTVRHEPLRTLSWRAAGPVGLVIAVATVVAPSAPTAAVIGTIITVTAAAAVAVTAGGLLTYVRITDRHVEVSELTSRCRVPLHDVMQVTVGPHETNPATWAVTIRTARTVLVPSATWASPARAVGTHELIVTELRRRGVHLAGRTDHEVV